MSGAVGDDEEKVRNDGRSTPSRPRSARPSPHLPATTFYPSPPATEEMKDMDLSHPQNATPPLTNPPNPIPSSNADTAATNSSPPPLSFSSSPPPPAFRRPPATPWDLFRRMTSRLITDHSSPLSFSLNEPTDPALTTFPSNSIRTSKYTLLTFLPLNLFEQFRRLANLYFLFIVLIQLIPNVSPFPIYTSVVPLVFILAVSAASEAREDIVRHRADRVANNRHTVRVGEGGVEAALTSADVRVGDVLKIGKGEEFPADLILLSSSRQDHTAYVNTANLDGEAAPKVRIAPQATSGLVTAEGVGRLRGRIKYEQPSTSLYRFQGQVTAGALGGRDGGEGGRRGG